MIVARVRAARPPDPGAGQHVCPRPGPQAVYTATIMSDFPDEWFRADDARRATDPTVGDEERWTDQFKPGYRAHPPTIQPAAPTQTSPATAPIPVPPSSSSHSVGAEPRTAHAPVGATAPRGRTRAVLPVLAGLVLTLVAGVAIGRHLVPAQNHVADGSAAPAPVASPGSSSAAEPSQDAGPWLGAAKRVQAISVEASCTATAKPGHDGKDVPSDASRLLDGDPNTGWRCDGDAVGQTLTFTLPPGTRVVGVRMTNGYTKTVDGTELYPQYRRVSRVTWRLPDQSSAWFVQDLADAKQQLQEIRIPESPADGGLQMTIDRVTEAGQEAATRDAVVLTEVEFLVRG